MKTSTHNEPLFTRKGLSPWMIVFLLKEFFGKTVSKRMVSHVVQNTIGESDVPPDGRGSKRQFSMQDAILIVMGSALSDLGLNPTRVRSCIELLKGEWDEIVASISLDPQTLERSEDSDPFDDLYLIAEYVPKNGVLRFTFFENDHWNHGIDGFLPRLITGKVALIESYKIGVPRPVVTYNVTWSIMRMMQTLFRLATDLRGQPRDNNHLG